MAALAPSVVVLGCGSVGLPLAVALAGVGHDTVGVDIDTALLGRLAGGLEQDLEPGLATALSGALARGAIRFADTLAPRDQPRSFIVCVPTPASVAEGLDARPLDAAIAAIGATARAGDLVCLRSTTPIGTTRRLAESLRAKQLCWAACPDRSLAGSIFAEQFETPHVVGGLDTEGGDRATSLFARLGPVVRVPDPETAEAIKLFANISRDVTFALANQLAVICEAAGIRASEVLAAGAEGYARFSSAPPGPVGGPCLSKDVHVLTASPSLQGVDLGLLASARALNESLAPRLASEILVRLGPSNGPVAILGLAFKGAPPVRDQRSGFGPALAASLASARNGLEIRLWDPVETPETQARDATLLDAEVVVLANNHPALALVPEALRRLAPRATVHDVAGVLPAEAMHSGLEIRRFGDGTRRP